MAAHVPAPGTLGFIGVREALRCDPPPHCADLLPSPREASDAVWASISNSAAWPVKHDFEDALEVGRNVIEALYACGFALVRREGDGQ